MESALAAVDQIPDMNPHWLAMWQMKEIEVNIEDEDEETSTVGDATEARVTYGKRKKKKVTKKVLQTDIFRAYSNRKVGRHNLAHAILTRLACAAG